MLRPVATLAAAGFIGVIVAKMLWVLVLPLLGAALGFAFFILKVLLIVSLIGLGWWCFAKFTDKPSEA